MEEKIYAYYEYGEVFVGIEMNRDLSNVKIADINGVNTRLNEFNSFDEMCKILNISSNKDEWNSSFIQDFTDDEAKKLSDLILETETGIIPEEDIELEIKQTVESDSKQEIEEENSTGIETVTISHTRTEHIDRDTYESVTEIEPLNLSDQTIIKQAEANKEAAKQALRDTVIKVEIVSDKSKEKKLEENKSNNKKLEAKPYSIEDFQENIQGDNSNKADELRRILQIKGCLLLISPPGEGKTTLARNLAYYITGYSNSEQVDMICFNSSTSYSDIISGLRIQDGNWKLVDGSLKKLAEKANLNPDKPYVLIIDEINRANTESVLGEWMTAIEQRGKEVTTNTGEKLCVPKNLFIIGTMNSYDQSIKTLDAATIDRFAIYNIERSNNLDVRKIKKNKSEELYKAMEIVQRYMKNINDILEKDPIKGKNNIIGNRVLYTDYETVDDLILVVKYDIKPKVKDKVNNLKSNERSYLLGGKIKNEYNEDIETDGKIDELLSKLKELV